MRANLKRSGIPRAEAGRPVWRRRLLGNIAGLGLLAAQAIPVAAQPAPAHLTPEPLPRLALLIGASSYTGLPPLSNVPRDVDALYAALDTLGFGDILVVKDPCLVDIYDALTALENRTRELAPDGGATVWIFVAGHGMADRSGHQYLMPVEFAEPQLATSEPHEIAAPITYLEERLEAVLSGAGIVVVDACRSKVEIPDSITAADEDDATPTCPRRGSQAWLKRSNPPPVERIGYATDVQRARVGVAYSTRPGTEAPEAGDPERPGTYVNALASALGGTKPQIPDIFFDAYDDVTDSAQRDFYKTRPDYRPQSLRYAWLRTLTETEAQKNAADWQELLAAGASNPDTVKEFVKTHSTSEYLRPALRWLKQRDQLAPPPIVALDDDTQTLQMRVTRSLSVPVLRHPVTGVRQPQELRSLRNEKLIVEREGWARLANASAQQPRYVRLESLVDDPADLPAFWTSDTLDVTACLDRAGDLAACIGELPRDALQPRAGERLNVLAVESERAENRASPSRTAFDRAFAVQRALAGLGIDYARSRIRAMPHSFAPAAAGRVLLKRSRPEGGLR